jgi:hypothetical protein
MDTVIAPRSLLIGAATVATLLSVYGGFSGPIRVLPTLAFMLAIPGFAWCGRLVGVNILGLVAVAVSLSLAMDIATSSLLLAVGLWSPNAGLWALVAATATGLICARTNNRPSSQLPTTEADRGGSLPWPSEAAAAPIGNYACFSQGTADPDTNNEAVLIVCAICAKRTEQSYGWLLANPAPKCPSCTYEMVRERDAVVAYVEGIRRLVAQVRAGGDDG